MSNGGKYCSPCFSSFVLSYSDLFSVDILYKVFILVFPKGWSLFSWKLFPRNWAVSNWSWVDWWTSSTRTYWHSLVGLFSTILFHLLVSRNYCICWEVGCRCSFSGKNEKSLMKFCLRVFLVNVSHIASPILYHLFGKSSRLDGNRWGHVHLSWYPSHFHSFWHSSIWFVGSSPGWNVSMSSCAVSFWPPNHSMKYVDAIVQLWSRDERIPHQRVACPVKDSTKLCRWPWSPIFFETSFKWIVGESTSLNINFGVQH